jgi:hypothetical protein
MNDQAILEQIAQHPKCRAVQLADRLDLELVDVQAALAALIAVGDVTAEAGTSPAGSACQMYDLSATFKDSEAYKPILAKSLAAQFATYRQDLGKTDRAIEFVRERGSATSSELHIVLQLDARETPSQFLTNAVRNGRLVKDGKNWTLGPNAPEAIPPAREPAVKTDALASGAELGRVEASVTVPKFAAHEAAKPLQGLRQALREPVPVAVPQYRFAVWSDGVLEVRKDGQTVVELPQAAADSLDAFLAGRARERAAA